MFVVTDCYYLQTLIPPQEKTVITEIVITVIQIIFKNPWLFQKHFVPLWAALLLMLTT